MDMIREKRQLDERERVRSQLQPLCVQEGQMPACLALMALDSSAKGKMSWMDGAYYAPINWTAFAQPPPPCEPTVKKVSCWQPGTVLAAVGYTALPVLTVEQASAAYAELERRLPSGAIDTGTFSDIRDFVRASIDQNSDGLVTRFELLAGASRLVRPSFWNDAYVDLLWKWP